MKSMRWEFMRAWGGALSCVLGLSISNGAWAAIPSVLPTGTSLRIVSYNISGDTTTYDTTAGVPPATEAKTVLQAIGAYSLAGNSQPIDVLALEELYKTPSVTLSALVGDLNTIYGANTYAYYNVNDPTDSTGAGAGPSGLIYNTHTISVLNAVAIGTVSGSGAPRAPLRFELQPIGYGSASDFYMYIDHYKANGRDTNASDANRRTIESDEIRQNADTLGPTAHVIYSGDFNLAGSTSSASSTGSAEQAYKDLIAAAGTTLASGATAGPARANDPLDPTNSFLSDTNDPADIKLYTESATKLTARFDFQLISDPMVSANNEPGMQLIPYTETAFGNSYYTGNPPTLSTTSAYNGSVASSGNTGPGLSSTVRTAMTNLTDHLPLIADYGLYLTPGDANGDGLVNHTDLTILLNGETNGLAGWNNGDFNGDGVINQDDFALFQYGDALLGSTDTVPEPTGLAMLGVVGMGMLSRKRR